jgi:hypothetical protein
MKRTLALILAIYCANALPQADLPERFDLSATAGLFDKIRAAPGFDVSKPATFGYFFNSENATQIAALRSLLEAEGFAFIETHMDRNGRTWLQVAKTEIHSPESLVERNRKLKALADQFGTIRYDGWDITRNAR